jgi:pimeloyl-ACP methyl ester carboxylesterase
MATSVVLVHGAWHGSWGFDRVMPLLRGAGVPAIAIHLPGHGDDPWPFPDLHGDVARVMESRDAPRWTMREGDGGATQFLEPVATPNGSRQKPRFRTPSRTEAGP